MGTRSLTFIKENNKNVCCMYRQYDGSPSGHGVDLFDFLNQVTTVQGGWNLKDTRKVANGINCLAAMLFAWFKTGTGTIYLYPADTVDVWEDYVYNVSVNDDETYTIEVLDGDYKKLFKGSLEEFKTFCENEDN